MRRIQLCLSFAAILTSVAGLSQNTNSLEFRNGDRVVLVGDTLIERENAYGFIEFMLTTHFPDRQVIFRNLGWSADTPLGQSRVGFDVQLSELARIVEDLEGVAPADRIGARL